MKQITFAAKSLARSCACGFRRHLPVPFRTVLQRAAILFLFLPLVTGCGDSGGSAATPSSGGFQSIEPMAARQLLQGRREIFLLDVRTPGELREGAIAGSVLVPFWAVVQGHIDLPAETPLLLVCGVGGRSYAAGQALSRRGFREVYNLSGGISAWKKVGLPVVYGN